MVTAEFQQRAQEQLQMTAEADKRNQEIYSWTVTAAQTSIPLTATQQTIHNAQIAQQLQIEAGAMTGTKEAPTQMIAMAAAQNTIRFQKAGSIIGMFAQITVSIAVLMIAIFLFLNVPKQQIGNIVEDEMPEPSPTVTRVNLYINNGAHSEFHEIPCSSDQLSEFAEKFLNEDVTLRTFREWMVKAGLVLEDKKPNDSIQITPKQELTDFLHGWLDRGVLPSGYEFETTHSPATASTSKDAEIMDNSLMDMVSHAHDNGGGGKMVLQSELR